MVKHETNLLCMDHSRRLQYWTNILYDLLLFLLENGIVSISATT